MWSTPKEKQIYVHGFSFWRGGGGGGVREGGGGSRKTEREEAGEESERERWPGKQRRDEKLKRG